jgi:hypothetical protein
MNNQALIMLAEEKETEGTKHINKTSAGLSWDGPVGPFARSDAV